MNEKSLKLLKTALADELLATYQYWFCVHFSSGKGKDEANEEFKQHYEEELVHASKVMDRLVELQGEPIANPKDFERFGNPWTPIESQDVTKMLEITIAAEQDAIKFYKKAIAEIGETDKATSKLFKQFLADEKEHEVDLTKIYDKISPKKSGGNIFL